MLSSLRPPWILFLQGFLGCLEGGWSLFCSPWPDLTFLSLLFGEKWIIGLWEVKMCRFQVPTPRLQTSDCDLMWKPCPHCGKWVTLRLLEFIFLHYDCALIRKESEGRLMCEGTRSGHPSRSQWTPLPQQSRESLGQLQPHLLKVLLNLNLGLNPAKEGINGVTLLRDSLWLCFRGPRTLLRCFCQLFPSSRFPAFPGLFPSSRGSIPVIIKCKSN